MNTALPSASSAPAAGQRLIFTGTGSEYFRIWIVNLLLTLLTLGIYSAWAKVRRLRYFYANTSLDGTAFEYHGNPVAILKGRLLAGAALLLYSLAGQFSPLLGLLAGVALAMALPWFIHQSLRFRLYNSSWRGVRFHFAGTMGRAWQVWLLGPIVAAFTLYLAWPAVHQRMKAWQHGGSRFGRACFAFDASVGAFYRVYALVIVPLLVLLALMAGIAAAQLAGLRGADEGARAQWGLHAGMVVLGYAVIGALAYAVFGTWIQRVVWQHTLIEQRRFGCDLRWQRVLFITVTNGIGIVLTLGLFTPFARVRSLRYQVECLQVPLDDGLQDIATAPAEEVGAIGDSAADLLDIDLSL